MTKCNLIIVKNWLYAHAFHEYTGLFCEIIAQKTCVYMQALTVD